MFLSSFFYEDGTTWNTTSFPSHWNAPYGTATSQHDTNASWYNSPGYNATNGGTANGTGELCSNLIDLFVLGVFFFLFSSSVPYKV